MAADLILTEIWFNHIFLKLPVKFLLRCKSVCKAWNRLLSDPEFVRTHILHQNPRFILLFNDWIYSSAPGNYVCYPVDRNYYSVDSRTGHAVNLNVDQDMEIIGSSNGLLCARIRNSRSRNGKLAIWNPSARDFKFIHLGRRRPYRATWRFGFCYDYSVNDANIVYFTSLIPSRRNPRTTSRFDIYSMKSDSWRIVRNFGAPFSLDGLEPYEKGLGTNGSIYWVVIDRLCEPNKLDDILVLNLKNSKFRKVKPPCRRNCDRGFDRLTVLGSSVGLYRFHDDQGVVVWTMKEGETDVEWIKLMDINLSGSYPESCNRFETLYLMTNGKLLLYHYEPIKLVDGSHGGFKPEFVLIDPVTNKTEKYLSIRGIRQWMSRLHLGYVESLVSLKSISSRRRR